MQSSNKDTRVLTFTCITCPLGCKLTVLLKDSKMLSIEGNKCPRGVVYAQNEIEPKRTLITVIKVDKGCLPVVSVKTSKPIPKELILEAMKSLSKTSVQAPIKIGDIVVKDLLGLKIDVIATRNVDSANQVESKI